MLFSPGFESQSMLTYIMQQQKKKNLLTWVRLPFKQL